MNKVVVVTTGGTIASQSDIEGVKVATVATAELLAGVNTDPAIDVELRETLAVNSFALTPSDMDAVRQAIDDALVAPDVIGVVVTHGTDTTEETAMLVDLFHDDPRPVVFTGAQRSADDPAGDGPANLGAALVVAASPAAREMGVLVVFDGAVYPARGTRKVHTQAPAAFADPDRGPVAHLVGRSMAVHARPARLGPLPAPIVAVGSVRVDIVAVYPGADRTAMDAHVGGGARALVLEGTGIGNATVDVVAGVAEHVAAGVVVVFSTRVHAGPVQPVYGGGGGGHDLVAAGAIASGYLRPSQARMQLIGLLASGADEDRIRSAFAPAPSET